MSDPETMSNHVAVVLALYYLEGWLSHIDTEDIAKQVNEIAPGQFSWRKYKDQINIDNVRWALLDAKKSDAGKLVTGSAKSGWMLTPEGYEFAKELAQKTEGTKTIGKARPAHNQKWRRREKTRMLEEAAYTKFKNGNAVDITPRESERFFNLDDYVTGAQREERITRLVNEFGNDEELGAAIRHIQSQVKR